MESPSQKHVISDIEQIFRIFKRSACTVKPHAIVVGSSGSGKSNAINTLCTKLNIEFLEINAAALTKEGASGASLSKILLPLAELANRPVIVFVDEFDKLFISGNSNATLAHEATNGVQNEFLKLLETDSTKVYKDFGKYVDVSIKHTLFVFAGTFNGEPNITENRLKEFGIKTEFLGRVGQIYNLPKLTVEDLHCILEESALLTNYLVLFPNMNKTKCVNVIKDYLNHVYDHNELGARLVNNLIHQYFIKGGLSKKNIPLPKVEVLPEDEFKPK